MQAMKRKLILFLLFFVFTRSFAYKYGEHKEIGDQAFLRFILQLKQRNFPGLFFDFLDLRNDSIKQVCYFSSLSGAGNPVSYGVLNALSGDHESNPLALEEQLHYRGSVMQRIIALHQQYIDLGNIAAPDGKLTKVDFNYALQAAINISHFYEYNRSFQDQLRHFEKALVKQCENPAQVRSVFKKLGKTNAVNMYVTLHTLAISLAEQSGTLATKDVQQAKQLLFYAFLFNGFADHFLEDAFSSGHLMINRTVLASVTNNKALHDFYSEHGTIVINRKGEIWDAYGDGLFNDNHHAWQNKSSITQISYTTYTREAERVINAVQLSLEDVSTAFERSFNSAAYTPFINTIPGNKAEQADYLLNAIPSLYLVPIPYNSRLSTLFKDTLVTDSMKKANQPLPLRNFVRSRIANSLVIGRNNSFFGNEYLSGFDIRLNVGNFKRKYSYNSQGGKKACWIIGWVIQPVTAPDIRNMQTNYT
jgi:hypothetical protein